MARKSVGPWFWQAKGGWFVWHDGKRFNLKVKGEENETLAVKAWHRLMAGDNPVSPGNNPPPLTASAPTPKPEAQPTPKVESTVKDVIDAFLVSKNGTIKSQTHLVYGCLLKHVTDAFGALKAESLKALDVSRWLSTLSVGVNTRCDIGSTLASAFKWAEVEGMIPTNPLKGLKRPSRKSRGSKSVVSEETHKKLLEAASPALRLLLTLLHETGARPSELAALTAQDVDFANGVAILNQHKTAHYTGKPRIIILSPKAVELLKTQAEAQPEGVLLRNGNGMAWKKDGIVLAMRRASKRAGVKATAYGYRHTFATSALVKGVPDAHVAALLGHTSTAMLHKHYSHLTSQAQALREALAKVWA
ncbi:MAG: site-specific integrase [Planctomycetia bacterium]|nr:site-specific integrase [Planctomycetia bacterium]